MNISITDTLPEADVNSAIPSKWKEILGSVPNKADLYLKIECSSNFEANSAIGSARSYARLHCPGKFEFHKRHNSIYINRIREVDNGTGN